MIELMRGQTPEELNFNFTIKELKEVAAMLEIKGRSRMDKIVLCLNVGEALN